MLVANEGIHRGRESFTSEEATQKYANNFLKQGFEVSAWNLMEPDERSVNRLRDIVK